MTLTTYDLQRLRAAALSARYRTLDAYSGVLVPGAELLALVEYVEQRAWEHVQQALIDARLHHLRVRGPNFFFASSYERFKSGGFDVSANSLRAAIHALATETEEPAP